MSGFRGVLSLIAGAITCLGAAGQSPQALPLRPPADPAEPPLFFEQVDLFSRGTFGTHTYRIPALAVTPAGTLLAICDARRDDSSDLPGNIDIVLRRSVDGGATWSPQVVIEDLPPDHGAGDPSLLVDQTTGRAFCFYAYGPPGIGFFSSQAGTNDTTDPNTLHAHVIWSDDEGLTWSSARDLNPEIKDPAWRGIFASSGVGIQLRGGRLLQPYAVREASGATTSRNAYSDDHGATWQMGEPAGIDTNESKLVELNFGIVMQNLRHNSVAARFLSLSFDGGHSFGTMFEDPTLIDPRVNAGLAVLRSRGAGDPDDLLAFTNPWSSSGRQNLEVRFSPDEGTTWPISRLIHPGPAAYSTLLRLPSGMIGLFYERGAGSAYEHVTFARFTESWVEARPRLLDASGRPNPAHPDLWAWLDAGDPGTMNGPGVDQDGDAVTRWDDRTWHGLHNLPRTTDGQGRYRAAVAGGLPAVELAGNVDIWGASGAEFGTLVGPFTIVMVARMDSSAGPAYLFDKTTGGGGLGLRANAGRWEVHAERLTGSAPIDQVVASAPVTTGQWQVHTLSLDGSSVQHLMNGVLATSATLLDGGVALAQRGLILGADFRTDRDAEAMVAEVIAFRRALSLQQHAKLVGELRQRYGI